VTTFFGAPLFPLALFGAGDSAATAVRTTFVSFDSLQKNSLSSPSPCGREWRAGRRSASVRKPLWQTRTAGSVKLRLLPRQSPGDSHGM